MRKIKTLTKQDTDAYWSKLNHLESLPAPDPYDRLEISRLRRKLELNDRRLVWAKRGIKVLMGGKSKAA